MNIFKFKIIFGNWIISRRQKYNDGNCELYKLYIYHDKKTK